MAYTEIRRKQPVKVIDWQRSYSVSIGYVPFTDPWPYLTYRSRDGNYFGRKSRIPRVFKILTPPLHKEVPCKIL